ncbi:MAG: tRNA (adenosine(37)-N6)-threonylcarbamoyltransferase complex dimerization subunit type 1 TsaB [Clostridium sp.]|nr:tRNA (adenosine(37)-N6)-threonylcarbamoyltransferase complex dimerization subunit type 1 TsaB [Clostridium sp.]
MYILSIDTSSNNCSVAILKDFNLLAEVNINYKLQHSEQLMPIIENLLESLDLKPSSLDNLCLSIGPGSFTGLRIGLSLIKGMALALNIPIYAANSLETLSYAFLGTSYYILPMIDALRGGYYNAIYKFNNNKLEIVKKPDINTISEIEKNIQDLDTKVIIVGDILDKEESEGFKPLDKIILANENNSIPRALNIPYLLRDRILKKDFDDINSLTPLYMRRSQAENQYLKKKGLLK